MCLFLDKMSYDFIDEIDKLDESHLRHCILFQFDRGLKATEATYGINKVYPKSLTVRKCQRWFAKFKGGKKDLEDDSKNGRPSHFDEKQLLAIVEEDPTQSIEEISCRLGATWSTVQRHLKVIGKVQRAGKWVPHKLTNVNKSQRSSICGILLNRNLTDPFLHRIVTGDEKWVLYENPCMKKQWLSVGASPTHTPKPNLHGKKVLLCIWWNHRGIIHHELMPPGETITAEVYCEQLNRLRDAMTTKCPGLLNRNRVILQHDNARPHAAKKTQQKLKELGWEVLPHPAYSPDLAPSDYHLFRSLQHYLQGKKFLSMDDVQNGLVKFFESKDESFFSNGIEKLISRWEKVIDCDGDYFSD